MVKNATPIGPFMSSNTLDMTITTTPQRAANSQRRGGVVARGSLLHYAESSGGGLDARVDPRKIRTGAPNEPTRADELRGCLGEGMEEVAQQQSFSSIQGSVRDAVSKVRSNANTLYATKISRKVRQFFEVGNSIAASKVVNALYCCSSTLTIS